MPQPAHARGPFRADQVGSLLRPDRLIARRNEFGAGLISAEALRNTEDECIREAVTWQESIGLQGISDGEFRRESFTHDFINKIAGVEFQRIPEAETGTGAQRKRPPFRALVSGPMARPQEGIEVANFAFLHGLTRRTAKLCIPSPTMLHFRGGRAAISREAYPDMDDFFQDLAALFNAEVLALADAGCRYLQFDDTNLAYLCDPNMRAGVQELGEDPDALLQTYIKLINDAIAGRPADVAITLHLCRGNAFSAGFAQGGYEAVAERLFQQTRVDGFFLEYDDARSGDFSPLRFVPRGQKIVLGLISSKNPDMEDKEQIKRRIDAAARHIPLDQLCLSPQCGFSSSTHGANKISIDVEKAKLALVCEIATEVWGE
ncbi:MAG: 5-methyltetrahydropteroyltriglutamate--homocysteine S-methyltransferase [Pseudomonadales bacterium]|nr:5-methyltetrahydropteroyltriglutamate--homocysteine S-methyltransferase [Pseudomonadales bacterium]